MQNICVLSFSALLFTSVSFGGVPSLGYLSTESLIVKNELSDESKKILNEVLENNRIESKFLDFSNRPIIDKDLSGLCLKNFNFSNSRLINVNLERCDLTETNLEGTVFEKVKLDKAILYTPVDELGRPVLGNSFKFDSKLSDYDLVILYSNLMKRNSPRAKALNKILGCLKLDLKNVNLKGRNLTGINLRGANLYNADLSFSDLRNANLSSAFLYSTYLEKAKLINTNLSSAILTNATLIFADLRSSNLSSTNLIRTNLSFSDLRDTNLSFSNLTHANLVDAKLNNANLIDANLIDANFKDNDIMGAFFQGAKLSDSLQIPYYDDNFNILDFYTRCSEQEKRLYCKIFWEPTRSSGRVRVLSKIN